MRLAVAGPDRTAWRRPAVADRGGDRATDRGGARATGRGGDRLGTAQGGGRFGTGRASGQVREPSGQVRRAACTASAVTSVSRSVGRAPSSSRANQRASQVEPPTSVTVGGAGWSTITR
ncbi:hypothetical protein GA0070623_4587 [Micromonospora rifamycinica]|uniref:Uncharacterized protein n=1 Tax=Micromonospora rifamycinica TaxID=291594 RepID=A0A1C5K8T4_9ACTN|nr:hypothetical protein GA0070623_4587 [Micromonospora rifamycinica]